MVISGMKLKDKITYYLARNQLARNKKFKNLHEGESCYIFGNGSSLKSMDLEKFKDKISIGCNSLFLHKDFNKLDCRYYQIPPALIFLPYKKFYGRLQRNYIGDLYRKKIQENRNVNFFTSFSNRLNMSGANIYYTYHFGQRDWNIKHCDLDGIFSFMAGATHAMIGTALYMGFESVILVGMDYTFSSKGTHFFEKGQGYNSNESEVTIYCRELFEECQKKIELLAITPDNAESKMLKFKPYTEYMNAKIKFYDNVDIVDIESLDWINKQNTYNIY